MRLLALVAALMIPAVAPAQEEPTGSVELTITFRGEGSWSYPGAANSHSVRIDRRLEARIGLAGGVRAGFNPIGEHGVPDVSHAMPSPEEQMALAREAQACGSNVACMRRVADKMTSLQQQRFAGGDVIRYSVWSPHPFESHGCVQGWSERVDDVRQSTSRDDSGNPVTETITVRASKATPTVLLPVSGTPPICSTMNLFATDTRTGEWSFAPSTLIQTGVQAQITRSGREPETRNDVVPLIGPLLAATPELQFELLPERNPHLVGSQLPTIVFRGTGETRGDTTIHMVLGRAPEEIRAQLVVSWRARLEEEKDDDIRVAIEGPACGCMNAEDAESRPIRFTATASKSGGSFTKFVVTPAAKAPREVANRGGSDPRLDLASTRETGPVTLAITYEREGKSYRAEHRVEFCAVDAIQFASGSPDHSFDTSQPARLEAEVASKAWHNGNEISPQLKWLLEEMTDGTRRVPGEATGATAKLGYEGLPARNSAFGEKTVTVRAEAGACACERETHLRTFHPLTATNHPPGDGGTGADMSRAPNWYYYWMQTQARQGWSANTFRYVPTIVDEDSGDRVIGRTLQEEELILLTDLIVDSSRSCTRRNLGTKGAQPDAAGIDCFAEVIRHEGRHLEEYRMWWKGNFDRVAIEDPDMDRIPHSVESKEPGCSSLSKYSCTNRPFPDVPDTELFAYYEGWRWPLGTANKDDWSCGGKQWEGGDCPK